MRGCEYLSVSLHGRLIPLITDCLLHGTADQNVKAFTRLILRTAIMARDDTGTVTSSMGDQRMKEIHCC